MAVQVNYLRFIYAVVVLFKSCPYTCHNILYCEADDDVAAISSHGYTPEFRIRITVLFWSLPANRKSHRHTKIKMVVSF